MTSFFQSLDVNTQVVACIVEPGDVLYVPDGWWRAVWTLSQSLTDASHPSTSH